MNTGAAIDLPALSADQVRTILAALEAVSPSGGGSAPYTLFRQLRDASGLAPSIVDVVRFQRNAQAELTGENA